MSSKPILLFIAAAAMMVALLSACGAIDIDLCPQSNPCPFGPGGSISGSSMPSSGAQYLTGTGDGATWAVSTSSAGNSFTITTVAFGGTGTTCTNVTTNCNLVTAGGTTYYVVLSGTVGSPFDISVL